MDFPDALLHVGPSWASTGDEIPGAEESTGTGESLEGEAQGMSELAMGTGAVAEEPFGGKVGFLCKSLAPVLGSESSEEGRGWSCLSVDGKCRGVIRRM